MKKKFIWFILIFLFPICPQTSFAEAVKPKVSEKSVQVRPFPLENPTLTFRECYERILKYYPVIKKQAARLEQARAAKLDAYMALAPYVRGSASVTTSDNPVEVFGMLLNQESFTQDDFSLNRLNSPHHRTNFNFMGAAELPLFNAFQTVSSIRSSKYIVQAETLQKELLDAEAILLAVEAYLRAILTNQLDGLTAEVKKASGEDLKQAEDLKDKGMVLGADFFAARMVSSTVEQGKNRSMADVEISKILLNILMGDMPEKRFSVRGSVPSKPRGPKSYSEWLITAYRSRKDLAALEMRLKAQRVETFKKKMDILPRINAFGALQENSHDLTSGGGSYSMGFRGTMDILDPSYVPEWKKAKGIENELQQDKAILQDQIAGMLAQEVLRYQVMASDADAVQKSFTDAKEAVEQTAKLYREGRKSIADLLDIRRAYLESGIRYHENLYQLEYQYTKLLFLSGILTSSQVPEIEQRIGQRP